MHAENELEGGSSAEVVTKNNAQKIEFQWKKLN